jgi:hypothetical protein
MIDSSHQQVLAALVLAAANGDAKARAFLASGLSAGLRRMAGVGVG